MDRNKQDKRISKGTYVRGMMDNMISGLCVSPGEGNGFAVICPNLQTASIPTKGDIVIILPTLDRDLIEKLTPNVVGVVAEKGSIGSHGAGILREMHIPCIVRVPNAMDIIHSGDYISISGRKNTVRINHDRIVFLGNNRILNSTYNQLNEDRTEKIRISNTLDCYRPTRHYQRLRFDMLKPAWEYSPLFLFGLPRCELLQESNGVVYVKNGPRILDICSYYLSHPERLIKIARQREKLVTEIDHQLESQFTVINGGDIKHISFVIQSSIQLYRELMTYVYSSQYIYDDLIEIFLDIVSRHDFSLREYYINRLRSIYVVNSVARADNPGVTQIWSFPSQTPCVWKGTIDYTPFSMDELDQSVQKAIAQNPAELKDFSALLQIVPLVYQMAEEFYYTSSSIHSFINRGLDILSQYAKQHNIITGPQETIYDWSIDTLVSVLDSIC